MTTVPDSSKIFLIFGDVLSGKSAAFHSHYSTERETLFSFVSEECIELNLSHFKHLFITHEDRKSSLNNWAVWGVFTGHHLYWGKEIEVLKKQHGPIS